MLLRGDLSLKTFYFSRFVAKIMVWTSLILSLALLAVSSVYCYMKYDKLKDVKGVKTEEDNYLNEGDDGMIDTRPI